MNHSFRYYVEELKKNPKLILLLIVVLVILIYFTSSNWRYISMLYAQESQAKTILNTRRNNLIGALAKREELIKRFVATYERSRNFVIIGDKSSTDLGVGLENDLRTIAEESGFEFEKLGQCRFNRISEELEIAEIQISAKDKWSNILWFMADIERSKPHFVWSNFSLSVDQRTGSLSLNGTLRAVVIKDENLIQILTQLPQPENRMYDTTEDEEEVEVIEEEGTDDEETSQPPDSGIIKRHFKDSSPVKQQKPVDDFLFEDEEDFYDFEETPPKSTLKKQEVKHEV